MESSKENVGKERTGVETAGPAHGTGDRPQLTCPPRRRPNTETPQLPVANNNIGERAPDMAPEMREGHRPQRGPGLATRHEGSTRPMARNDELGATARHRGHKKEIRAAGTTEELSSADMGAYDR